MGSIPTAEEKPTSSSNMPDPKSKEEVQKAFVKVDVDGSGRLSFKDMKKVIEALSSEEEKSSPDFDHMATMICNMADVNGDKMIDFGEIDDVFWGLHGPKEHDE